ncbi:hypothetical protein [Thermogemmatispora onikobensis]|uniref:hypothetical protein n=1 Tax=Thermogemmatispora onikobensis TaxID=732234 RepID=UPI00085335B3|nr:hypothetical protein [Thermogemmatispora onikobensis]
MVSWFSGGAGPDSSGEAGRAREQERLAIPCRRQGWPAFTEEDVRTYLAEHPPFFTMFGSVPGVGSVRFLPVPEAASVLAQWRAEQSLVSQLAGREQVCLVELLGPFQIHDPLRPLGRVAPIASRLYLLFDAGDGALLTWVPADQ